METMTEESPESQCNVRCCWSVLCRLEAWFSSSLPPKDWGSGRFDIKACPLAWCMGLPFFWCYHGHCPRWWIVKVMKDWRIWWKILYTCTASLTPFTGPSTPKMGSEHSGRVMKRPAAIQFECGTRTISGGHWGVTEGNDLSTRFKNLVEIRSWFQCVGHLQILAELNNHEEEELGQPGSWP